jgi:3'(2'), 5'-bisphosphate nucleotidase
MKISNELKKSFLKTINTIGIILLKSRNQYLNKGKWVKGQYHNNIDKKINKILSEKLKKILDVEIQSEEKIIKINYKKNLYWLIDPIDGTASYSNGFDGFVTQAALIENNKPILSAVYAPKLDLLFYAVKNKGAFLNNRKIFIKKKKFIKTIIDNFKVPTGISRELYEELKCKKYIESGSLGLKSCFIASNKADIFVKDIHVKIWDVAPAMLIMSELGGKITDFYGKKIILNKSLLIHGLIVSQSSSHNNEILKILKNKKKKVKQYLTIYK